MLYQVRKHIKENFLFSSSHCFDDEVVIVRKKEEGAASSSTLSRFENVVYVVFDPK